MAVASTDRLRPSLRLSLSRMEDGHLLYPAVEEVLPAVVEASWPDGAAEADRQEEEVEVHNRAAEAEVGAGGSFLSRAEAAEALVLASTHSSSRGQPAPHRCNSSNVQDRVATVGPAWSDRDSIRATRHPAGVPTHSPPLLLHHLSPTPAS